MLRPLFANGATCQKIGMHTSLGKWCAPLKPKESCALVGDSCSYAIVAIAGRGPVMLIERKGYRRNGAGELAGCPTGAAFLMHSPPGHLPGGKVIVGEDVGSLPP